MSEEDPHAGGGLETISTGGRVMHVNAHSHEIARILPRSMLA
jgi:hypothetical protein